MGSLFRAVTNVRYDHETGQKVVEMRPSDIIEQQIFVNCLELEMSIGVLPEEKLTKQRVVIDADITVTPTQNWQADNIQDVVSYADIVDDIKKIAAEGHINLVETFAQKIIQACMMYKDVQQVSISVHKPDIMDDVDSVGVSMTASR
jgi:dihydroneopterin aldolase